MNRFVQMLFAIWLPACLLSGAEQPVGDPRVNSLLKQLGSINLEEREDAAEQLYQIGEQVLPKLNDLIEKGTLEQSFSGRTLHERIVNKKTNAKLSATECFIGERLDLVIHIPKRDWGAKHVTVSGSIVVGSEGEKKKIDHNRKYDLKNNEPTVITYDLMPELHWVKPGEALFAIQLEASVESKRVRKWRQTLTNTSSVLLNAPSEKKRKEIFQSALDASELKRLTHPIYMPSFVACEDHRKMVRELINFKTSKATNALLSVMDKMPPEDAIDWRSSLLRRLPLVRLPSHFDEGFRPYTYRDKLNLDAEGRKQLMSMFSRPVKKTAEVKRQGDRLSLLISMAQCVPEMEGWAAIEKTYDAYLAFEPPVLEYTAEYDPPGQINAEYISTLLFSMAYQKSVSENAKVPAGLKPSSVEGSMLEALKVARILLDPKSEEMPAAVAILKRWQQSENGQFRAMSASFLVNNAGPHKDHHFLGPLRQRSLGLILKDSNPQVRMLGVTLANAYPKHVKREDMLGMVAMNRQVARNDLRHLLKICEPHGIHKDEVYKHLIKGIHTTPNVNKYVLALCSTMFKYSGASYSTYAKYTKEQREEIYQAWSTFLDKHGKRTRKATLKLDDHGFINAMIPKSLTVNGGGVRRNSKGVVK